MRDHKSRMTAETIGFGGFATITTLKLATEDLPMERFVTVWAQPHEDGGWEIVQIAVSKGDFEGDLSFLYTGTIYTQRLKEKSYKVLDSLAREMCEVFGAEAYMQIRLGDIPEKKHETKGKPKAARRGHGTG